MLLQVRRNLGLRVLNRVPKENKNKNSSKKLVGNDYKSVPVAASLTCIPTAHPEGGGATRNAAE